MLDILKEKLKAETIDLLPPDSSRIQSYDYPLFVTDARIFEEIM